MNRCNSVRPHHGDGNLGNLARFRLKFSDGTLPLAVLLGHRDNPAHDGGIAVRLLILIAGAVTGYQFPRAAVEANHEILRFKVAAAGLQDARFFAALAR